MLRLGIPVLGVDDVARAEAFWTEALGLHVTSEWGNANWRTLSGAALPHQQHEAGNATTPTTHQTSPAGEVTQRAPAPTPPAPAPHH
ncbi:VOC family protein [Amycolatopsis methanolica]|uniref:VOC family protein n=1 Tax=Amycolatopsis methanolica TaxID=1814 RepID=UPI000A2F8326|nr:VOC family protein [Amycolatopsis methanolica]